MKRFILINFILLGNLLASSVITCGDAFRFEDNSDGKYSLHKSSQERAQKEAENFMGKKIKKPYGSSWILNDTKEQKLENMISLIEIFWCENINMPLHSAYYNFYMRNKDVW